MTRDTFKMTAKMLGYHYAEHPRLILSMFGTLCAIAREKNPRFDPDRLKAAMMLEAEYYRVIREPHTENDNEREAEPCAHVD